MTLPRIPYWVTGSKLAAGLLTAGPLLLGCGEGEVVSTGVEAPIVTTTIPTTTTTATTIDFNRPITQTEIPLVEDAGSDDIAALVADIRGQSADVDAQVRRLAPFPDLAPHPAAQIMDIAVALAPELDDRHPSTARLRYRVPTAGPDVVKDVDDSLRSLGWFHANKDRRSEGDVSITELVYLSPGDDPEELQLRVAIEARPDLTIVDLEHSVLADADEAAPADDAATYFERLSAWQEDLPLPRSAQLIEVAISTSPEAGSIAARYHVTADDEADAIAAVITAIGSSGYRLVDDLAGDGDGGATGDAAASADEGDGPAAVGPLELIGDDGTLVTIDAGPSAEEGLVTLEAVVSFDLAPLD